MVPLLHSHPTSRQYKMTIEMELMILKSAKVRTTVLHFPGLTSPVKEIGFGEVKEKSLTSVEFEPTTSEVDHQRSNPTDW